MGMRFLDRVVPPQKAPSKGLRGKGVIFFQGPLGIGEGDAREEETFCLKPSSSNILYSVKRGDKVPKKSLNFCTSSEAGSANLTP